MLLDSTASAAQRWIAARMRVGALTQYSQARPHGSDLCLLPRNNFFREVAHEWIPAVDEQQASHFDRACMVRDHGREEIDIWIASHRRCHHGLVHRVHACNQRTAKIVPRQ